MTSLKLRKTMTLPNVIEQDDDVMTKDSDSIQNAGEQLDAVTMKLHSFGTIVEAIFAEGG